MKQIKYCTQNVIHLIELTRWDACKLLSLSSQSSSRKTSSTVEVGGYAVFGMIFQQHKYSLWTTRC